MLDIQILTEYDLFTSEEMLLSWNATTMTEDYLEIQLYLKDPLLVSSLEIEDKIWIEVLEPRFFVALENNQYDQDKTIMESEIPL